MKKLYRYEENTHVECYEDANKLKLVELEVKKITPCGFWVNKFEWTDKHLRFVLSGSNGKRYAYETKEAALNNFIKRKTKQIQWNRFYMEKAKFYLEIAKSMLS